MKTAKWIKEIKENEDIYKVFAIRAKDLKPNKRSSGVPSIVLTYINTKEKL